MWFGCAKRVWSLSSSCFVFCSFSSIVLWVTLLVPQLQKTFVCHLGTNCVCVCFWTVCLWLSEQKPSTASLSASRWWTSNLLVTHLHTQSSYSRKHSQNMRSPHENLLTWVCRKSKLSLHYQIKVANQIKERWVAVRWHWWYFKDSPYIIRCWLPKALRLCYFYHLASRTTGFRRAISYMILNCGFYVDWCNLPLFRSTFNIHIFN